MAATITIVAALWILGAYLAAKAGEKRGWGFKGFFLLGLFLTPILTATVLGVDALQGNPAGKEPSVEERLATLERLHASGTLSDEEYASGRAALEPPSRPSPRSA